MTAKIRTPQRTVSAMQRFAVSQKNRTEAITISPFSLSLPYRTENRRFLALSCTKTGSTQPKLSAACFVCVEHDTHLVQKTVPQVFTAKCSEPQAVIREDMSERSG